jgi:hypothetical protein
LQLIDFATLSKKPIIFISGDAKEDWWWQHEGNTIGPRWELGQEMHEKAGVRFHMYTTPRFLEYAQQSLDVKSEPTRKAKTEFEEIEKQDKQAADQSAPQWLTSQPIYAFQPPSGAPTATFGFVNNVPWTMNIPDSFTQAKTLSPEEVEHKNKLLQLLPFNGLVFASVVGTWACEIESTPPLGTPDRACYKLRFRLSEWTSKSRPLALWVSLSRLKDDADWKYKQAIARALSAWLSGATTLGEMDMTA